MIDGFYSVVFEVPGAMGGGTIVLQDGTLRGGDSTMFYAGEYSLNGTTMSAKLHIGTHLSIPGHMSVFGIPQADLVVAGKILPNGAVSGEATSPQAPGIKMRFTMKKIVI